MGAMTVSRGEGGTATHTAWAAHPWVAPLLALRGWGHGVGTCPAWGPPSSPALGRGQPVPWSCSSSSEVLEAQCPPCVLAAAPDLTFGTGGEEHVTSARRSAAREGRCAGNPKSLFSAFFAEALAACQIPRLFDIHSATLIAFHVEEIRAFPGLLFSLLPGCPGWLRAERWGPAQKGPAAIQPARSGLGFTTGPCVSPRVLA